MRFYLLGYFHAGAFADDVIRLVTEYLLREIAPGCRVDDVHSKPHPRQGPEVAEFFNREADVVLFCGGSLLGRLKLSPFHCIEQWINHLRVPLVIFGTGWRAEAQPLTDVERMRMQLLVNRAAAIYVRGECTAQRLRALTPRPVRAIGDPGLCWPRARATPTGPRRVGVVVRQMAPVEITQDATTIPNEQFHRQLATLLDHIAETEHAEIVFIPMSSMDRQTDNDFRAAETVQNLMRWDSWLYTFHGTVETHDPQSVARALGRMDFVVSQRLHGSLIALAQGVPVMPIEYQFGKMDDSLSVAGFERLRALITPMADVGVAAYQEKRSRLIDPTLVDSNNAACAAVRGRYRQAMSAIYNGL